MRRKDTVVIGLLGASLDSGEGSARWEKWRPTVALCQHEDFLVSRLELLREPKFAKLATRVAADVRSVSPETEVREHDLGLTNPWDFEEVYDALAGFARGYAFDTDREDYLVHITTGSHVEQICLFLLTESRFLPGRLLQTSPPRRRDGKPEGECSVIDLDLSRYDRIASRFRERQREGLSFLKAGIDTRNAAFNRLIEEIEQVAVGSKSPILLTGPTGAGKTQLASRIYELKKSRRQVSGRYVEVNCATLRGDGAMSALFGHVRGAFTGALRDRPGLLRAAEGGLLFLDEIAELGLDEQAMLLRALEAKVFLPLGSDKEVSSDFQLIAGTNRDLRARVREGRFREDLLARIDSWTFSLPGLAERPEDVEPNLDFEIERYARSTGMRLTFSKEARERFLAFSTSPGAAWRGNFRDLGAAVMRLGTLAAGGRVTQEAVEAEIARLRLRWQGPAAAATVAIAGAQKESAKSPDCATLPVNGLDRFDEVQLAEVLRVCRESASLSEAGRKLFAASRSRKTNPNDADRVRKYLARFNLDWKSVVG